MTSEQDLREQLALCTRIFAMQGMIGLFGAGIAAIFASRSRRVRRMFVRT